MQTKPLGRTNLQVSAICLGSMTWGTQNTEAEAHEQMSFAADYGVNFIDTAEMYPTNPLSREKAGLTEKFIGTWLKSNRHRNMIIGSKVAGEGSAVVRDGGIITGKVMRQAIEASLKNLQIDCIDVYQLHWPNRGSYHFRKSWTFDPFTQPKGMADHVADVLETAESLRREGKLKYIGLSNESAWGVMQFVQVAEANNLPRIASIQNEYNLLYRTFDLDLAEVARHEDVGLLAFSPLSAGMLTGKYQQGHIPPGSRRSINPTLNGRHNPRSLLAVEDYKRVAAKHGLDLAQMSLAFVLSRPFVTSVIIGATTMDQLRHNLKSAELQLAKEAGADIAAIHRQNPMPM